MISLFENWKKDAHVNKILNEIDVFIEEEKQVEAQNKLFKSPYDFIGFAMTETKIPKSNQEAMREGVEIVIDLALAHPDVGAFKSE